MLVSLLCVTILTAMLGLASSQMSSLNCDSVPPSLWCSSQEMAKTCGFDALCNKYLEANQEKALQVTIIFESLCPYSRSFLVDVYYTHVYKRFGKLVKTELLPFGNADLENGNVVCSHGSLECQVDSLEVCAINYLDEPFHFVYCLEKKMGVKNSFKKALKKCFRNLAIPLETARKISECSQSEIGAELRKKTMDRIKEMKPEGNGYVPWLAFNGVSLESAQYLSNSLNSTICQMLVSSKSISPKNVSEQTNCFI